MSTEHDEGFSPVATSSENNRPGSRIPDFYRRSVSERLHILHERGFMSAEEYQQILRSQHVLSAEGADKTIENVIGVLRCPWVWDSIF